MIDLILFAFIAAIIVGWFEGGRVMNSVRSNPKLGVKPTKDCGSFIFIDIN